MSELSIDGFDYRTGRLNAKQQFHIARRLAPLIAGISAADAEAGADNTALVFENLAKTLSSLTDKDCDYVLGLCMSVVTRKSGDRYAPVWNKQIDQPVFDDLTLPAMMQLAFAVIQDNLGGFIPAQGLPGLAATISAQNGQ